MKWFAVRQAREKTEGFERDFWSGGDLNNLYQSAVNDRHHAGSMERVFEAGFREFTKLRVQKNLDPKDVVFVLDVSTFFNQQVTNFLAFRTGLVRDQLHTENLAGVLAPAPAWVSLRFSRRPSSNGPMSEMVARTGMPLLPNTSQKVTELA